MFRSIIQFKSDSYFIKYCTTLEQIVLYQSRMAKWPIYFIICSYFHFIVISCIASQLDNGKRFEYFILADMLTFLFNQQDKHLNYMFIIYFAIAIIVIKYTFLDIDYQFVQLLQVIFSKEEKQNKQWNSYKPIKPEYRGQKIYSYLQRISYWIIYIILILEIILILNFLNCHWIFLQLTLEYSDLLFHNSWKGWILYLVHWFNCLTTEISFYTFSETCYISTVLSITLLWYLKIRFTQNIDQLIENHGKWWSIRSFIQNDLINFRMIFICNAMYGRILAIFIIIHMPCNAYLMTRIIFKFNLFNKTIFTAIIIIMFVQYLFMVVVHILAAKFSTRAHCTPKYLFHFMKNDTIRQTSNRIKINLTIARLHTTNRYGVTYGKIALITMQSFAKVSTLN